MGKLMVEETFSFGELSPKELWSKSGNQGTAWKFAILDLAQYVGKSGCIRIIGVTGRSFTGDAAVDDLVFYRGQGGQTLPPTVPPTTTGPTVPPTTTVPTLPSTTSTPAPTPSPSSSKCGFEGNSKPYCGIWKDETNNDFDWKVRSGGTSSGGTGPSKAHEGSKYLYIETSSPRRPGDKAVLTTCSTLGSGALLSFYYNMNGATMGKLSVEETFSSSPTELWSKSGNQGTDWKSATLDLGKYVGTSGCIRIIGVAGSSYTGDAAIDELVFYRGQQGPSTTPLQTLPPTVQPTTTVATLPPTTLTPAPTPSPHSSSKCGFEGNSKPYCGIWKDETNNDFDWKVRSGGTPSGGTGPSKAHAGSKYLYIETSSPRRP